MATVIFIPEGTQKRYAMRAVINYCQQDYKTYDSKSKRKLISGINCDGENAYREFMATKMVHGKANGIFFYHYSQSFAPTEKITPEQAHEIALEFAEKAWEGYEVMVATHCDRGHIHSHFVINSVGYESGMKLRQPPSTLKKLRKLSDEICQAHGFSVLQPYTGGSRGMSSGEYRAREKGESWKQKLADDIDKAMEYSGSRKEFERAMSILGYHMTWTDARKNITFHCPNGKKCCDDKLHSTKYLKENIENELAQRELSDSSIATGWETSRELYEQHLKERALTKAESQRIAESYPSAVGNVSSLAGAVSHIVGDDSEGPDERRKRIEAEENGEALGTIIGKGIDLIAGAVSKSTAEKTLQEPDYSSVIDRQCEEILQEVFEEDDYDEEDDEDEGFIMSM